MTKSAIAALGPALLLALAVAPAAALAQAPRDGLAADLPGDGGVLVVGDSLEVLTKPYLQRHLPGVPLTHNAVGGYNSNQIFDLFEESYKPSQSVIVFDAGTNDNPNYPQIVAGNLDAVTKRIGDRCMVVPTIHGLSVGGVGNGGKNRAVRAFAESRPGTQTPNWARVAATRSDLMQPDDLHPTPEGADRRARLIAEGVPAARLDDELRRVTYEQFLPEDDARAIDRLNEYVAAGVTHFILLQRPPYDLARLEQFLSRVAPHVKR